MTIIPWLTGGGGGEENINRFQQKKRVRAGLSNDVF